MNTPIFCVGCDKPMIVEQDDLDLSARCPDCGVGIAIDMRSPEPEDAVSFPITKAEIESRIERVLGVDYVREKYRQAKGPMKAILHEAGAEILRKQKAGEFVPPDVVSTIVRALEGTRKYEQFR